MFSKILKSLAIASLAVVGTSAIAQVSGNGVSGNGVSGVSGVSGGLGIDFAGSQATGANQEGGGGFTSAVEAAFTGTTSTSGTGAAAEGNPNRSDRRRDN